MDELVILKKPPTFTWPVMSVVADCIIAASIPPVSAPRRTRSPVTAASAVPEEEAAAGVAGEVPPGDLEVHQDHGQSSEAIASTGVTRIASSAG